MSETKYPLCARAGIAIIKQHGFYSPDKPFEFIEAADVEKLLEGAPVVYCRDTGGGTAWRPCGKEREDLVDPTHTARLVMIEPIVKDSAERLLSEMIEKVESGDAFFYGDFVKRAKAILETK